MVLVGTAGWRVLGWQQRGEPRPLLRGQLKRAGGQDLDRAGRCWPYRLAAGTPGRVTALGESLVAAAEGGPRETKRTPLWRLVQCEEQAADLRRR